MMNHATTEVFFDDLRVPAENLIGEEGKGFRYILAGMNTERILIAAECIGDAKWFIEKATAYAKDRNLFGRPIGQNQGVQFPIARAYAQMRAAELMVHEACRKYEAGEDVGEEANMAKMLAADASWFAADMCVQTHGGFGFAEEYDIERKFRETRLYQVAPISTNLILSYIAEHVLGSAAVVLKMSSPPRRPSVVSVEQAVAAPQCTCRLADAGARVIKVERPEGDFARHYDYIVHGESAHLVWLNRGKESVVLDLTKPDDKALLEAMLAKADVFVQNLKPGALGKLGFAFERLRKDYPRLICASISGYGESGPYARRKAYDLLIQAESGLSSVTGGPEAPARVGVSVVDIAAGLSAYEAILEAIIRRARSGEGATISISMFDAMAEWMTIPLLNQEWGNPFKRVGLAHPTIAPYGVFKTRDGAEILISIQNDREWRALADKVLGNAALGADERFATNPQRQANRAADRRRGRQGFCRAGCRALDEKAGRCRHRLRPRQRFGAAVDASASAPHHGRYAEWTRQHAGAGCGVRR